MKYRLAIHMLIKRNRGLQTYTIEEPYANLHEVTDRRIIQAWIGYQKF